MLTRISGTFLVAADRLLPGEVTWSCLLLVAACWLLLLACVGFATAANIARAGDSMSSRVLSVASVILCLSFGKL